MADTPRPQKIYRLNYHSTEAASSANVVILADPAEVRVSAGPKNFLAISEDGMSLSPGIGNTLNMQTMGHNMKFGGMMQPTLFPMMMMSSTTYTPIPKQTMSPPMPDLIETLNTMGMIANMLVL